MIENVASRRRTGFSFNSLPNDIILELTKLQVFADVKLIVAQMMISCFLE